MSPDQNLSRRERQIMDALFQSGEATAAEVRERIPDPPTYTAVRTLLRILEEKGLISHRADGRRFVYAPIGSTSAEGRHALSRVLQVFFGGSLEQAVEAHLSDPGIRPSQEELQRMRKLIEDLDKQDPSGSTGARKGKKP